MNVCPCGSFTVYCISHFFHHRFTLLRLYKTAEAIHYILIYQANLIRMIRNSGHKLEKLFIYFTVQKLFKKIKTRKKMYCKNAEHIYMLTI